MLMQMIVSRRDWPNQHEIAIAQRSQVQYWRSSLIVLTLS
jgi:hypothetical protein